METDEHEKQEPVVTVENDLKHVVIDFETAQHKFTLIEALAFMNDVLSAILTLRNVTREEDEDEEP